MLTADALATTVPDLPLRPVRRTLYRAINYEALTGIHNAVPYVPNPLFCNGAPSRGARYTPRGGMRSLYFGENVVTAYSEANQAYLQVQSINPSAVPGPPPTVIFSAVVSLEHVLDITDPDIQHALQTNVSELHSPWLKIQLQGALSVTQQLGKAAFDSGSVQAIRYPSAAIGGDICWVLFCDRIAVPSFVHIYDPDGNFDMRLP